MMDAETIYEKWRTDRSQGDSSEVFPERVMRAVEGLPLPAGVSEGSLPERSRLQRLAQVGFCAAAVVAAVFRVVELLGVFATTGIEN
jgi:hypothetical protein